MLVFVGRDFSVWIEAGLVVAYLALDIYEAVQRIVVLD